MKLQWERTDYGWMAKWRGLEIEAWRLGGPCSHSSGIWLGGMCLWERGYANQRNARRGAERTLARLAAAFAEPQLREDKQ